MGRGSRDEGILKWRASTLKHMHSRGRLSRKKALCEDAARGGHLDVLKWARENDCPWDEDTCWRAAVGGDAKWARANGCPWNKRTCSGGGGGHLEVLKWAAPRTCWAVGRGDVHGWRARRRGHLEMKWARENDCPWDEDTCSYAAMAATSRF